MTWRCSKGRCAPTSAPASASTTTVLRAAVRAAAAEDVLAAHPHGFDRLLTERGANLSGGQRQRIGLARALVADPPVLVLHNPTTAVDAVTEGWLAEGLASARGADTRGTVLITTSPALLRITHRVAVIDQGGSSPRALTSSCSPATPATGRRSCDDRQSTTIGAEARQLLPTATARQTWAALRTELARLPGLSAVAGTLLVAAAATGLVAPWVLGRLVDDVIAGSDTSQIVAWAGVIAGAARARRAPHRGRGRGRRAPRRDRAGPAPGAGPRPRPAPAVGHPGAGRDRGPGGPRRRRRGRGDERDRHQRPRLPRRAAVRRADRGGALRPRLAARPRRAGRGPGLRAGAALVPEAVGSVLRPRAGGDRRAGAGDGRGASWRGDRARLPDGGRPRRSDRRRAPPWPATCRWRSSTSTRASGCGSTGRSSWGSPPCCSPASCWSATTWSPSGRPPPPRSTSTASSTPSACCCSSRTPCCRPGPASPGSSGSPHCPTPLPPTSPLPRRPEPARGPSATAGPGKLLRRWR